MTGFGKTSLITRMKITKVRTKGHKVAGPDGVLAEHLKEGSGGNYSSPRPSPSPIPSPIPSPSPS